MRIDPKSNVAGMPALEFRKHVRSLGGAFKRNYFAERLDVDDETAERLWTVMLEEKLIEHDRDRADTVYRLSEKGLRLANATARTYSRAAATKNLRGLLERIEKYNLVDEMPYIVRRVTVFGSYARGAAGVGDVDLFLDYDRRCGCDPGKCSQDCGWWIRCVERRRLAWEDGRYLCGLDEICWPETERDLILKGRSAILKFVHDNGDREKFLRDGSAVIVDRARVDWSAFDRLSEGRP